MTLGRVLFGGAGGTHRPALSSLARTGIGLAAGSLALGACATPVEERGQAVLAVATTHESPASPETAGDAQIGPVPSDGRTPSGAGSWDDATTQACAAAVGPGFWQAAQAVGDLGVTSFWSRGRRWVVCDVAEGAEPVLLESSPGGPGFDVAALSVATTEVGAGAIRVVAGGRLPWPVADLRYTFPGGHTEKARFVTGTDGRTWWSMVYTARGGALVDAADADDEPVTIRVTGAAAEAFRVAWKDLQRSE